MPVAGLAFIRVASRYAMPPTIADLAQVRVAVRFAHTVHAGLALQWVAAYPVAARLARTAALPVTAAIARVALAQKRWSLISR